MRVTKSTSADRGITLAQLTTDVSMVSDDGPVDHLASSAMPTDGIRWSSGGPTGGGSHEAAQAASELLSSPTKAATTLEAANQLQSSPILKWTGLILLVAQASGFCNASTACMRAPRPLGPVTLAHLACACSAREHAAALTLQTGCERASQLMCAESPPSLQAPPCYSSCIPTRHTGPRRRAGAVLTLDSRREVFDVCRRPLDRALEAPHVRHDDGVRVHTLFIRYSYAIHTLFILICHYAIRQ